MASRIYALFEYGKQPILWHFVHKNTNAKLLILTTTIVAIVNI